MDSQVSKSMFYSSGSQSCSSRCPALHPEPVPGHLHQGGILISRGGTNQVVCVGVSGGKRAICDHVQLLMLAKACNRFLMCAVLSVSLSLSKSITFSKEGR